MVVMEMVTKKTLRKWQKRLGLQDWHITLETRVKEENMRSKDCWGCTEYAVSLKEARIQIHDPIDAKPDFGRGCDELETFVHEMIEIKFSLIRPNDDGITDKYIHQMIDDLARAFVDAERSGCAEKP